MPFNLNVKGSGNLIQFDFRFHPGVNRCYCPSEEVAKRALVDGLVESQISVFGLPIRPSFCRAVLSKVSGSH